MRSTFTVLAASVLLAAGAGCGDEDEPAAGGTTTAAAATTAAVATTAAGEDYARPEPPAEQSSWAAQVDEACEPVQRQIDALPPPTDAASLETWVEQVLPLVRKQVEVVKEATLPAKEEEADRAKRFVESLESIEGSLTRYLAALRAGDAKAIEQALTEANAAGAQARASAVSLDVTECGGYSGS